MASKKAGPKQVHERWEDYKLSLADDAAATLASVICNANGPYPAASRIKRILEDYLHDNEIPSMSTLTTIKDVYNIDLLSTIPSKNADLISTIQDYLFLFFDLLRYAAALERGKDSDIHDYL